MSNQRTAGHHRYSFFLAALVLFFSLTACQVIGQVGTPTTTLLPTQEAGQTNAATSTSPGQEPTLAPGETSVVESTPGSGDEIVGNPGITLQEGIAGDLADLPAAPRYAIQVGVNFADHTYQGTQHVEYTNSEDTALESIYFHLLPNGGASYGNGSLTVSDVQVNEAQTETRLSVLDSILEVPLSQPLEPGEEVAISLAFSGDVPVDFGGGSGYGIFNFSNEVLSLSGWYPILAVYDQEGWNLDAPSDTGDSVYADIAFYDVTINVSTDVILAATGVERQAMDGQAGRTFQLAGGPVREFYVLMSPNFEVLSEEVEGTTVHSYYLSGSEEGGQVALDVSVDSIRVFNQQFGPYPYTQLDVAEIPMRYAAGVEFSGVILLADYLYDTPTRSFFLEAIAHEVAHMWWYNTVGNDVFDEPWLDESLTTYSAVLYFEYEQGEGAAQALLEEWEYIYENAVNEGNDDLITQSLDYYEQRPELYGVVVYIKGGLFFHNLRQEIGDEAFFTALQNYYTENLFEIATADDLLNAFEEAAGRQLDDFYELWLYSSRA